MVRLGWWTGKLYSEEMDYRDIKECWTTFPYSSDVKENDGHLKNRRANARQRCATCTKGCEERNPPVDPI